jgi:hypothetical protein
MMDAIILKTSVSPDEMSLLQNRSRKRNFSAERGAEEGAGGQVWHDVVSYNNTLTPAKWILPDAI